MNTSALIEALLEPDSYPHPVDVITTIETHISIVFLTGSYAYKLKKPVDFGFLDFSDINARKRYCHLEVELNQRSAPELYLGVQQITLDNRNNSNQSRIIISDINDRSQSEVIDYLVKMRQFDPNHVLGRLLQNDKLEFELVSKLVDQITQFHKNAEHASLNNELGTPEVQLQPMTDNFPSLFDTFKQQDIVNKLQKLSDWTEHSYRELKPLMIERKQQGFIRACHGDLHLDNIALINNQPVLFDGIEFNDYFRWIDVISDLAFLLIDLDFRKQKTACNQSLSLYLSQTLDYNGLFLLNFYRVYRTLVRAKITALRALQLPADSLEQKHVLETASSYIDQAYKYINPTSTPKCIVLQGVSGSGKSYFANQMIDLIDGFNAVIISSDRIRKSLFGLAPHDRPTDQQQKQLYSANMNKKTYQALADYSEICLKLGFNVIVDATFLKQQHRQVFQDLAFSQQADYYQIFIQTSVESASNSISQRQLLNSDPSDANIDVMKNQLNYLELPIEAENALSLKADELRHVFPIKTIQDYLNLPLN